MAKQYLNVYKKGRLSAGLTQEAAAESLSLSVESLKAYEAGRRLPPDETVGRMAAVYQLPYLALVHRQATDCLGVLPKVEPRPLPLASIALRNRIREVHRQLDTLLLIAEDGRISDSERPAFDGIVAHLRQTMAAMFQVIYAGTDEKKDRPGREAPERSVQKEIPELVQTYNTTPPGEMQVKLSWRERGGCHEPGKCFGSRHGGCRPVGPGPEAGGLSGGRGKSSEGKREASWPMT